MGILSVGSFKGLSPVKRPAFSGGVTGIVG